MIYQSFCTSGDGVRVCRLYSMIASFVIAIVLIGAIFPLAAYLFPGHWNEVRPVLTLFLAWVAGVASAYYLPIWKRKGVSC